MGPCRKLFIGATLSEYETAIAADNVLEQIADKVLRTRKGRNWQIIALNKYFDVKMIVHEKLESNYDLDEINLTIEESPFSIAICSGSNKPEDYDFIQSLSDAFISKLEVVHSTEIR